MTTPNLKPCPFCGGKARMRRPHNSNYVNAIRTKGRSKMAESRSTRQFARDVKAAMDEAANCDIDIRATPDLNPDHAIQVSLSVAECRLLLIALEKRLLPCPRCGGTKLYPLPGEVPCHVCHSAPERTE